MKRGKLDKLRELIVKASASLTDTDALDGIELFDEWATDTEYAVDKRVRYNGTLYKCLQAHTSQDTWTPTDAPSLWARVDDPSIEYPEWIQPESTNPYMKGDKVSHNEKHWISNVDNNVWEPGFYGWDEVA
jgi:hypothetical protein